MSATEAEAFMARLEAGEAIRTIIGGAGGRPLCSRKAFFKHCELHPEWGKTALAFANTNGALKTIEGNKKRYAARTHCQRGHEQTGDNVGFQPSRGRHYCKVCHRENERKDPSVKLAERAALESEKRARNPERTVMREAPEAWKRCYKLVAEQTGKWTSFCRCCEKELLLSSFYPAAHDKQRVSRTCISCADAINAGSITFTMNATEADRFIERLEAGDTLRLILNRKDAICQKKAFLKHCELHPAWAERAHQLAQRNAAEAQNRKRLSKKAFATRTHCSKGHPLTPENVGIKPVNGTRYCKACNYANVARGKPITPDVERAVRNAILTNMKITDIYNGGPGRKPICTYGTLRTARRLNADLGRFFDEQLSERRAYRRSNGGVLVPDCSPNDIPVYIFQPGDYEWLYGLTPRHLPKNDRDVIVSDLWIELTERRLRREDVPTRAKDLIKKHNRENPSRAYGDIRSPLSLDAPAYLDGTMLRGETVSESLWERL
ncbi:hypothetical protein [Bradyrhizobium sp. CCBAU 51753]|uniref:hypothetical protein n=1 Tax=Bradyrhizobium sp. CCBAU 51753 TaxID=1325100 RepID=UPI00188A99E5|nr:hypothetical protein [Bradyrhizobium sp. CCBAU 51753]QOZ24101.1 hypothetical protein XH93_11340 [Bradyrhizobium sp. CCBAU 51753]